MIKNKGELTIALQAVLASVLALSGYYGWALVMFLILLPWKPVLTAGGYLAQPLVDWWLEKPRVPHGRGIAQIEREFDFLLGPQKQRLNVFTPAPFVMTTALEKVSDPQIAQAQRSFKIVRPRFQDSANNTQNSSAIPEIQPAIRRYLLSLRGSVLNNMDLEIEQLTVSGNDAEATVAFKSPKVTGLALRQSYVLQKSGDRWQVETKRSTNSAGALRHPLPTGRAPMRLT